MRRRQGLTTRYEYAFAGQSYRGRRDSFFDRRFVDHDFVGVGEEITVHLDPVHPADSVRHLALPMSRERCERQMVFDLVTAAVALLAGLVSTVGIVRTASDVDDEVG